MPIFLPGTIMGGGGGYQISRSARFRQSNNNYFSRTYTGSATDLKAFTISMWVKRAAFFPGGSGDIMISSYTSVGWPTTVQFDITTNQLDFFTCVGASAVGNKTTNAGFRDQTGWMHILAVFDSANGTAADRMRLYVNGVRMTSFSASTDPALNATTNFMATAGVNTIGQYFSSAFNFNGYMAELYVIDGQALAPTAFGEFSAQTGQWVPKQYTGTYGNWGYYLNFSDNSVADATHLGKDNSGNGNNWTPNNFSVAAGSANDSLVDTPTPYGTDTGVGGEVRGNYPYLSSLATSASFTMSNANMSATINANNNMLIAPFFVNSGKWYFECSGTASASCLIGVCCTPILTAGFLGALVSHYQSAYGYSYGSGGIFYKNESTTTGTPATYTAGDIIGVAIDATNGTVTWYKNGVSQGGLTTADGLIAGGYYCPNIGESTATATAMHFNAGQRPFAFAAPAGYKAFCTANLQSPAIQNPSQFMDVDIRTGTGSAGSVSGKSLMPDLVWTKSRSARSHALTNAVVGATKYLSSDATAVETTDAQSITSFNADGFSFGTAAIVNQNAENFVDWLWKRSVTAGVDIVTYTGTGVGQAISHNLGITPAMFILKKRGASTGNWIVWHQNLVTPGTSYLVLNTTAAQATSATVIASAPSSTVINIGTDTDVNQNTSTYVGYVFAQIPGFSKFGTYTGTAAADGALVWCGFKPKFVLIKAMSAVGDWYIYDGVRNPLNITDLRLLADTNGAEGTTSGIDFLAQGFKLRTITTDPNAAVNYVYMAFAESPFNYSTGR